MDRKIANTVLACVAFMAVVVGLTVRNIVMSPGMDRQQLSENGLFLYEVPREIDNYTLVDQNGESFETQQLLTGQWTLIFFGYTFCPDICPLTLATLSRFSNMLGEQTEYADDTRVMMVSVDPRRDTPAKLDDYMGYFSEDYIGATGEYIDIFNFASNLNVAFNYTPGSSESDDYLVSHSGEIILINPNGHFHGFFKTPHDPQQMLDNYKVVRESW